MPQEPLTLQVDQLVPARAGRAVHSPLSFVLHTGCALEITGPNGSGKTSLLRTLAGLIAPHSGSLRWLPAGRSGPKALFAGHLPAMHADLALAENLVFDAALRGSPASRSAVIAAMEQMGLPAALAMHMPGRLSEGQRKRASLCRLLLAPAHRFWLLDEPFNALDQDGQDRLRTVLARHLEHGGLVAFSTHQPGFLPGAHPLPLAAAAAC